MASSRLAPAVDVILLFSALQATACAARPVIRDSTPSETFTLTHESAPEIVQSLCRRYLALRRYADHGYVVVQQQGRSDQIVVFETRALHPRSFRFQANNFTGSGQWVTVESGQLVTSRSSQAEGTLGEWLSANAGVTEFASIMVPPLLTMQSTEVSMICSNKTSVTDMYEDVVDGVATRRIGILYGKQPFTIWVDREQDLVRRWTTKVETTNGAMTFTGAYVIDLP